MSEFVSEITDVPCTAFCEKLRTIQLSLPTYKDLLVHFNPLSEQLQHGYPLGTLAQLRSRTGCAFCQLVLTVASEDDLDLKADSQEYNLDPSEPIAVVLFPDEQSFRLSYPSRLGTRLMFVAEEAHQVTPGQEPHVARIVQGGEVQASLLRGWLQKCEDHHGNACWHVPQGLKLEDDKKRWKLPNPAQIRVLDLESGCLRHMSLETRYVALSYVWGQGHIFRLLKDNCELLEKEGSFENIRSDLPQTINDAIEVVKSLGERYLWVDTLCLVQDDVEDVKYGVEIMNSIYQGAYFTIVAGSGANAYSGLPGVRPGSRKSLQTVTQVGPNIKMAVVHSIDWHLKRTVHNRRGWTLQELVLAPRSVIFINNQVYFRCLRANWSEDTFADMQPEWLDPDDSNISRIPAAADGEMAAWWAYQKLLEDYSNRELRFEGDALRAAAGILRVLTAGLNSWYLEGIPAYYLDIGLIWISADGNMKRRSNFGSFSWAGWSGRIMWPRENYVWPEEFGVSRKPENMFRWITEKTFVRWLCWKKSGSLEDVYQYETYDEPSKFQRLLEEYAHSLPAHVLDGLGNTKHSDHSPWSMVSGSSSFMSRPKFRQIVDEKNRQQVATLFTLELVNSQAELNSLTSRITNKYERLMMYNWQASKYAKSRMYRDKGKMLGVHDAPKSRWTKGLIDYREPEMAQVKEIGEEEWETCKDRRYGYTKYANDCELKNSNRPPLKMPNYPPYALLHFHTISLKLRTGAFHKDVMDPMAPNRSPNTPPGSSKIPSTSNFERTPGLPLLSVDGELVGSLHLDSIQESAYPPGTEVELVILSRCFLPTTGSALPAREENNLGTSGNVWDMFWVLHIIWKETAIAERRGIGQILDSALSKACGAGPEDKFIMLA